MTNVGSIISGAFRLIRERPGAVAVWGLAYMAAIVASTFALRPFYAMQAEMADGQSPPLTTDFFSTMGLTFFVQFILFLVSMVLFTASMRAVLRPRDDDFAFLRLGMDELRQIGLALLFAVVFYVGLVIVGIAAAIVVGLSLGAAGGTMLVIMMALLAVGLVGVLVWLAVRLSLSYPLTLLRRRIVIGESWRLTGGRFWVLFLAYLVIGLVLAALWIVAVAVASGPYFADLLQGGFSVDNLEAADRAQMARQASGIDGMTFLSWLISALVGGIGTALGGGAIATATRELAGTPEDELAATFD